MLGHCQIKVFEQVEPAPTSRVGIPVYVRRGQQSSEVRDMPPYAYSQQKVCD
jgi:hypothetical protein